MGEKRILRGCPLCGHRAFWRKGDLEIRIIDTVECPECGLTIEGDYEPQSSISLWNHRVLGHMPIDRYVTPEGYNL